MTTRRFALRRAAQLLHRHPLVAFVLMGAAFVLFGFTSVDLYVLLAANLTLFLDYGPQVIADGALTQLAELLGLVLLSAAFYAVFAACERILVRRLTEGALPARRVE